MESKRKATVKVAFFIYNNAIAIPKLKQATATIE
jgi:hypothetical protein